MKLKCGNCDNRECTCTKEELKNYNEQVEKQREKNLIDSKDFKIKQYEINGFLVVAGDTVAFIENNKMGESFIIVVEDDELFLSNFWSKFPYKELENYEQLKLVTYD